MNVFFPLLHNKIKIMETNMIRRNKSAEKNICNNRWTHRHILKNIPTDTRATHTHTSMTLARITHPHYSSPLNFILLEVRPCLFLFFLPSSFSLSYALSPLSLYHVNKIQWGTSLLMIIIIVVIKNKPNKALYI